LAFEPPSRPSPPADKPTPPESTPLPDNAALERLAKTDPIAFIENCLRRYDRDIKSYRAVLQKKERIKDVLYPTEVVDVDFREHPFSFRMVWKQGIRKARKSLYVRGENDNKVVIRPEGVLASWILVSLDPNGAEVKDSSRYPPEEFGIKIGTEKTLAAWKNARRHGDLKVKYLGEQRVKEAGNRLCWVLQRTGYVRHEEDGITRSVFYFDQETWLQVGSVLWRNDELLGEFYFRDVQINPKFDPDTFTRKGI
jgi:hypothetical protein